MPNKGPIKRNPAIAGFSREHHTGLLLVWKIREGLRKAVAPERIGRYVVHAFDTDLEPHFLAEETLLFNRLDREAPLKIQAENEHRDMRSMVSGLRENTVSTELLENFARILENHIRFEERTLFNYLQDHLPAAVLAEIEAAHPVPPKSAVCEIWPDVFWDRTDGR